MERAFFNLWFNASLSFLGASLIVALALAALRGVGPAWQVYVCSLPFAKLLFDLGKGVPARSWLNSGLDLYALPEGTRWLSITAGSGALGPYAALSFAVNDGKGGKLALSIPDWALAWIETRLWSGALSTVVLGLLLVSSGLVLRELWDWVRYERRRRRDVTRASVEQLGTRLAGKRHVALYVSDGYRGSPFTGGLLKPWICFPRETFVRLSQEQREAVIAHELGHVRMLDPLQNALIRIMAACFWLVPGYGWITGKLDAARELLADRAAVRSGVDPLVLADVLVGLQEVERTPPAQRAWSALVTQRSTVGRRVRCLLEASGSYESRIGRRCLHGLAAALVTLLVILSNFGGNGVYR